MTENDRLMLRRTLTLARRGAGRTSPNPMVGAIVEKNGVVISEGYHPFAGGPHAEVVALRAAGGRARGAALYVSLEPCCHWGKTPPCTEAIIRAGISRVVFSSQDPNPLVAGQGAARLRAAGIEISWGALAEEEAIMNEGWRHWLRGGLPFVTLKLAASLDGRVATANGESQWITGAASRRDGHRLRAAQDAILTSSSTVLSDDPSLTARIPGGHDPRRIVLDSRLRTSPQARVYLPAERPPIMVTAVDDEDRLAPFRARGVEVVTVPASDGGLDLCAVMASLGARGIATLMVEAGGTLAAALLCAGLVNKIRYYLAPIIIGGDALPVVCGLGTVRLAEALKLRDVKISHFDDDIRIEGYVRGEELGDRSLNC